MSTQEQSAATTTTGTQSPDALVVGAGTAGCYAAATIAREGTTSSSSSENPRLKPATSPAGTR